MNGKHGMVTYLSQLELGMECKQKNQQLVLPAFFSIPGIWYGTPLASSISQWSPTPHRTKECILPGVLGVEWSDGLIVRWWNFLDDVKIFLDCLCQCIIMFCKEWYLYFCLRKLQEKVCWYLKPKILIRQADNLPEQKNRLHPHQLLLHKVFLIRVSKLVWS